MDFNKSNLLKAMKAEAVTAPASLYHLKKTKNRVAIPAGSTLKSSDFSVFQTVDNRSFQITTALVPPRVCHTH